MGAFAVPLMTVVASALVSKAMAPKAHAVEVPDIKPPTVMPTPDSEAIVAQKSRSVATQVSRRGRASTVLTQGGLDQGTTLGA